MIHHPPHSGIEGDATPSRPYRIAFVLAQQGSLHRFTLLRRFVERESDVVARWLPIYMWRPHDPLWFLPSALRSRVRSILEAGPIFADAAFDAVVFHAYTPHVAYTWYKWLLRRPTRSIWYRDNPPLLAPAVAAAWGLPVESGPMRRLKRHMWRATFARTDLIVSRCDFTKRLLMNECGVPEERIHVLHIGVDLDRWPRVQRPLRPESRRVRLLFVGGDFERKGGDVLLRVFRESLADRCELHLVTSRAQFRAALGSRADEELGGHVYLHADVPAESATLQQLYAQADLFVLPSRIDLAPFAILEAMAAGLPVISTAIGGIPELVTEGVTGQLITPNDAPALRDALARLVADPALCCRMGAAARQRVEDSFDARVNVPALVELVRREVDRQAPVRPRAATCARN